jgi:hypothetical protein
MVVDGAHSPGDIASAMKKMGASTAKSPAAWEELASQTG